MREMHDRRDMGTTLRRSVPYALVVYGALVWACASCQPSTAGVTSTSPPSQTPTLLSSPTSILLPTRTPAPTARPLRQPTGEEGSYHSAILGVALTYPTGWELIESSEAGSPLLWLMHPDGLVVVVLEWHILGEGDTFQEFGEDYFAMLVDEVGLPIESASVFRDAYRLRDGTEAWQEIGVAEDRNYGENMYLEVISVDGGSRIYTLVLYGLEDLIQAEAPSIEQMRSSLQFYAPSPYGVERENALFVSAGEPDTLDPAKWHYSVDSVIGDLYSGLVRLDTDLQPIPDLAERWEVSEDGMTYTFYLRKDVTFHNGKVFTAADVVFTIEHACDPKTQSDTVLTYLGDIVGVQEVVDGERDHVRGLRQVDDYTIEISLNAPKPYFLYKLAYPTSWIVDQETIAAIEEAPNGTGPFKLMKHVEDEIIVLARHSNYHLGYVPLEYVVYLLYQGYPQRLYESGEIDFLSIDEDLLERAKDPSDPLFGNVHTLNSLCTHYVVFDVTRPPFDDAFVRKAFAQAIDKDRYNDVIFEGRGVMANGLYPPGLPGFNPDVRPLGYDPDAARQALQQSSYGSPEALPEIVFTMSGAGGDISPSLALLIEMWREVLHVEVSVEQFDSQSFLDEIYAGHHGQLVVMGWCADYPDPQNFAEVLFHTGSEQNHGGYSNPELDALMQEAQTVVDFDRRIALYQEIEQRLVDDVAAVFISHSRAYYVVVKPYVVGYVSTPIGVAQHMNLSIVRED